MNLYWIAQSGGWFLYGLATYMLVVSKTTGLLSAANVLLICVSGLVISHALRYIYRQSNFQDALHNRLPRYFLILVIATVFWEVIIISGLTVIYPGFSWQGLNWFSALFYFVNYFLTLLIWTLFYQGYRGYLNRQRSELEKVKLQLALKDAQLQGLRFQMNPHFLFNALNSIRTLALDSPKQTREMITRLSALLRYSLSLDEQPVVSLETELDIVRHYLAIEQIRFESRLEVQWHLDQTLKNVKVLPLSIQTLVENAVKHGIDNNPKDGKIVISTAQINQNIVIKVSNPGRLPEDLQESIGCKNTKQRLNLQFGQSASLLLTQAGEQVEATMTFAQTNIKESKR